MVTPHPFEHPGAIEMPVDPRDFTLLGSATVIPEEHMVGFDSPVYYQGQQPACGAHAGVSFKCMLDKHEGERDYSPRFNWIDIKSFDGYAIEDGTDMRSIMKSLKNTGAVDFKALGNNVDLTLKQYASVPQGVKFDELKKSAAPRVIDSYAFLENITFDSLKQAIYTKGPVILLLRIGSEFWTDKNGNTSWKSKDILPLRVPKSIVSGHFVVAHAYDKNFIYFLNSWSKDWGDSGHGHFGPNYIPYVVGAGTAVDRNDADVSVPVFTFTKDLSYGMTDSQVRELQKYLNTHGFPVAPAGQAGSTGNETTYFGNATKAALIKFQLAKGINPPQGYFGPITRSYIAKNV